jgi:hypothetical protein
MLGLGAGAAAFAMFNTPGVSYGQRGGALQGADQRALAKLDLESVMLAAVSRRESSFCGGTRGVFVDWLAAQRVLGVLRPPRHGGHPAKSDARCEHPPVQQVESHGRRGNRKLIGLPVTYFPVSNAPNFNMRRPIDDNDVGRSTWPNTSFSDHSDVAELPGSWNQTDLSRVNGLAGPGPTCPPSGQAAGPGLRAGALPWAARIENSQYV